MATKWCTKLDVGWKRCPIVFQGHLSNFKVSRDKKLPILTQIGGCPTVTPVWIYQWLQNDSQSLKKFRRCAPMFFKVIRQISMSHGTKITNLDPNWAFLGCNSSLNSLIATKWCKKLEVGYKRCPIVFQGDRQISRSHGSDGTKKKITNFDPNCVFPDCNSSLNSLMATKWYTKLEVG